MTRRGAALAALLLAGCGYLGRPSAPYRPPAVAHTPPIEDGRTLYLRDCAWCHGERGQGTERGPDLLTGTNGSALVDFVLSTGRMPIEHPSRPLRRGPSAYSAAQIQAIAEFAASLGAAGPAVPEVDPGRGDLALGGELYQENCAACHATTGIGGAFSTRQPPWEGDPSATIATPLNQATPRQVAEAMLTGPGGMPVFGPETFSQHDVDSLVRYVQYLQEAGNPGGVPMGKIGPWSEGAAAWLVGLGVLLVVCRWIGTRE